MCRQAEDDQVTTGRTHTSIVDGAKLARPAQAHRFQQDEPPQTAIRFRPFRRRALSTLRPPLVRIRARNPCVFLRRLLCGW
jgi:hypothetical protein